MNRKQRRAAPPGDSASLRQQAIEQFRRGQGAAARRTVERALAIRPDAELWLLLSGLLVHENALARAEAACDQALALAPGGPAALRERASVRLRQNRLAEAAEDLRQILAQLPDVPDVANNLGATLFKLGQFEEAAAVLQDALARHPGQKMLLKNLAASRRQLGDFAAAEAAYRAAIASDPHFAEAHRDLALLRLLQGDVAGGFADYEWRWRAPVRGAPVLAGPRWNGQPMQGTLLLHFEQGHGDTVQFLRFVPRAAARAGRTVLCVPAALKPLAETLPGAEVVAAGGPIPACDAHAYLLSLPHLLGLAAPDLEMAAPYVAASADRVAAWRARLGALPGRKIGIVLAGNPEHENDRQRSIDPGEVEKLARLPGISLIGLRPGAPAHPAIHDVTRHLGDFGETAGALAACDLLISVDTAAAHLAGALGRPVWLLLPRVPDWRWGLSGTSTAWYPTMRLFRQRDGWAEVMGEVREAVEGSVLF